ncbi:MAG: hypothetical protein JJ899_08750, partial [Alphaproteobacteria bacterium]|nr:hypothetical protein [Alphaproteobacteria bacterium]
IWQRRGDGLGAALSARVVGEMNQMMQAVITRGSGRKAGIDRPAGGKTGTSQDFRDAWFVGYAGNIVTAVWLGNDDNSPMDGVTGSSVPAEIWKRFMSAATKVGVADAGRTPEARPQRTGATREGGEPPARRVPERRPTRLEPAIFENQTD